MLMEHDPLSHAVIGCAMRVHTKLGPGFLESVYKNALAIELRKSGLSFEAERPVQVFYDAIPVGTFSVDILVEAKLLLELKAVQRIAVEHEVQVVNYLTATGIDHGLLLNFGGSSLEFKRKFRKPKGI